MCLFKPSCLMGAGLTGHRWGWSEVAGYGSDLIAPVVASWGRRSRVSGRPGSSPASVYTWCGVRLLLDSGRRQSCNHLQQGVRRERGGRLDCRDDRRLAASSVSKAGLNALTRLLAGELARDGILVNAVCPGWPASEAYPQGRTIVQAAASVIWAVTIPN